MAKSYSLLPEFNIGYNTLVSKFLPVFLYLALFALYIQTLSPSVSGGDSGELITSVHFLSIAHPPGYPLYTLLGKLFTFLPVGTVAFRVNLLSAFFTVMTALIIFWTLKLPSFLGEKNDEFSLCGAVLYAVSFTVWSEALVSEVYPLYSFLFSSVLYTALLQIEKPAFHRLLLFSFLLGIITSHSPVVFTLYPAFFYVIWKGVRSRTGLKLPSVLYLLGLAISLYLPVRFASKPSFLRFNLETWHDFMDFLQALGFQEISLDMSRLAFVLPELLLTLFENFTFIGTFVAIYGLLCLKEKNTLLFKTFLSIFVLNLCFSLPASFSFDIMAFFIPSFVALSICAGCGLEKSLSLAFEEFPSKKVFHAVPVVFVLTVAFFHCGQVNQSKNKTAETAASRILQELPPKSVLVAPNSSTFFSFSLFYVQQVEGMRRDVALVFPMYLRSEVYLQTLQSQYPFLSISPGTIRLAGMKRQELHALFPGEFFKSYFQRHLFMAWLDRLGRGAIQTGIGNHYRNLFSAKEIMLGNTASGIFLLNNEIYETPGLSLTKDFLLYPGQFVFQLLPADTQKPLPVSTFPSRLQDAPSSRQIFSSLHVEKAKAYQRTGRFDLALEELAQIHSLPSNLDLSQNTRGISDTAVKEFLEHFPDTEKEFYR